MDSTPSPLVEDRLKKLPWIVFHSYIPWQAFRMEVPELVRYHAVRVEPENPKNWFSDDLVRSSK